MNPAEIKVFLAGEGPNELGRFAKEVMYRDGGDVGVVEALLKRLRSTGWSVVGAEVWKNIRKYRAGVRAEADTHNVRALALEAHEANAHILVFLRDSDGEGPAKVSAIRAGMSAAQAEYPELRLIGGVPLPKLEAWILALQGETRTDELTSAKVDQKLKDKKIPSKDTSAYVEVVERAQFACVEGQIRGLPPGCDSLHDWLKQAHQVLCLVD